MVEVYPGDNYAMSSVARLVLPLSLLVALFGCKENNISNSEDNDFVAQTIGAEGGDLELGDEASVHIPVDALADDVELRLGRVTSGYPTLPDNGGPTSGIYLLEPRNLSFSTPVTLSVKASEGSVWLAGGGQWMMLPSQPANGRLAADTLASGFFASFAAESKTVDGGTGGASGMGGSSMGDGTLVRGGLPGNSRFFAVGDTHVFYAETGTDAFGAESNLLRAAPIDTMDPPVTIADFGVKGGTQGMVAVGDNAYWIQEDAAVQPPTMLLYRGSPGGTPELVSQVSQSMAGFSAANGSVLFLNANRKLQIYDTAAGAAEPTEYGEPANAGGMFGATSFTRSEDHVFFLMAGQDQPYQVWASELGSAGADTGITFPGAANIVAMGGTGSTLVLVTAANNQQNVLTFDTTTPGAQPMTIANFTVDSGGGAFGNVVIEGDELFATTFAQGATTGDVLKISLPDGAQTKLGSYLAAGFCRPVAVNSNGVYSLLPGNTGDFGLYRWAR
jgi:hypothetical protein